MKKLKVLWTHTAGAGLMLLLTAQFAIAHGPPRQKVTVSMEINASAEQIWAVIGDFGMADQWLPMVEGIESEGGNAEGATRILELGGNARIFETLSEHSDENMSYSYRIPVETHDVAILPVNNYSSTLSVMEDRESCIVTWRSTFYRGDPTHNPPPELDDEAAVAAVTAVYEAGLANLKTMLESQ